MHRLANQRSHRPYESHAPTEAGTWCIAARCSRSKPAVHPQLLEFALPAAIADFYVLSPFVTYRAGKYEMAVRLVNRDDDPTKKISRIHYAASGDGVRFEVGREVIAPGGARRTGQRRLRRSDHRKRR